MVEAGSQAKTKIKLMTHVFKHPKFYEEYRKRAKLAQKELKASQEKKSISPDGSTDPDGRTPKAKPSSNKQQAGEAQASSYKRSSHK